MRITFSGRVYPTMLKGVLKTELAQLLGKEETSRALKAADTEYESVLDRTPDLGGDKNPFLSTLYIGAYAVALYKQIKGQVSLNALESMVANGINGLDIVKKLAGKTDYLSKTHAEKERENAAWLDNHPCEGGWAFSVEQADGKVLKLHYRACGLLEMVKRENVAELAPVLCRVDSLTYGLSGFRMRATKTLAAGDGLCEITIERNPGT